MKNGLVLDVYVYIYIQIYYMYVYIIKYLVVLYIYIYIFTIYIYTPKPGRSPTRQYSVLSCFFPSRPASDLFLDFKKHFLLAV